MLVIKQEKVMKMQLLTVSILLFLLGCDFKVINGIRIDDYEFYAIYEFNKEIKKSKNVDVISNIKKSKKIKGPVIGMDIKTLMLVNKREKGDTLKIIIYGKEHKYFRIGNDFYIAKNSIF